ncbi:MAG TPA: ribosome-associated translation inhibitor RaiA [Thermoanaerobaculia bacterium]|mgnify:CR=1 FL=1|nr:ribosome-associated translation inhibitor RaiA [Thermoanaerobaculia bacterium]HUM29964.1 ribosome-associated translation inhibitor RaiA [Thermoanaerobaculia bacterium]HXK68169.1 ribosome-associated translation inhibitor RaiA [Thermoanaerobaculia bacterium]
MRIDFHAKKFELSESFQDFVQKRLKKFQKYLDDTSEVRVNLEELKANKKVEILVHEHGDVIQSHASGLDMREAFMDAVHKLDVQLEKKKKKLKDRKRREAHKMESQWQLSVIDRSGRAPKKKTEKTLTTTRLEVRTLSVEDAVTLMDKSGDDILVFRDVTDGAVRFIHRRKDGKYNLIIPE